MNKLFKSAIALTLGALMFVQAGCGGKAPEAGADSADPPQEVIVAFGQDIVTFDTHNYRGSQDIIAAGLVYDTLVSQDKDHQIIPALAESWEWVSPNELKFNLRKDVKFHGGEDFNAECVKFSIERNNEGSGASFSNYVTEVRIIDDHTVVLYMETPYGPALSALANNIISIISPVWAEKVGDKIVEQANGTGAYILEEFSPGSRAVFVKNPNYWGTPVALDRIEFRPIPETGTRVMALKSGEVDIIENPPPQEIASIEADPNLYVYKSPKLRTLFMAFNLGDPNVGGSENKALREAIAYAVNPEELAEGVLEGLAISSDGNFFPDGLAQGFADTSFNKTYDLEKAKKIVADNNLEGKTISLWCTRGRYLLDSEIAEVLQSQISKIGINAQITVMEYGPMMTACAKWEQESHQLAWGWNAGDPSVVLNQLFSSAGAFNCSAYQNPEFDQLVKDGSQLPELEDRMEYYNKALKMIVEDEADLIPLVHYMNLYAANKKVEGLHASLTEMLKLQYASIGSGAQ